MSDSPPSQSLDPAASVQGLLDLARARAKAGDSEGAGRTFAAALHLAETHGLWGPTAQAQSWLAGIDVRRGRLSLARERLDRAHALCVQHAVEPGTTAEVAAQLGQVLVFQGSVGAGVALMSEAVATFRSLGCTTECDELELALAAVQSRVDQAVRDAKTGSEAEAHAWLRRAEVRLGLGSRGPAREDLARAWATAAPLPPETRARVGLDYSRLLVAEGPEHHDAARAVLQAVRASLHEADWPEVDALVARTHATAPET